MYDTVNLNDITNSDVAISKGNIFVVWEDDNSGTVKFRKGTYTPSTSINKIEQNYFVIYPNPANEIISVQFNDNIQSATLVVLNVLGETVLSKEISDTISETIQINELPGGIYFLQVRSEHFCLTQKFVKE